MFLPSPTTSSSSASATASWGYCHILPLSLIGDGSEGLLSEKTW